MKSDHILFSASTKPLALLFRYAFERRGARLTAASRPPSGSSRARKAATAETPVRIALVTWEDILDTGSGAPSLLDAVELTIGDDDQRIPTVVVLVPYASFVQGDERWTSGVAPGDLSLEAINGCASMLGDRPDVTLIVSPMILASDWFGGSRSPSVLQRLLRVARFLTDEVRSKVPEYFTAYPLRLDAPLDAVPNAASIDAVVDGVLNWIRDSRRSTPAPGPVWQESLLPWSGVHAVVKARLDVSCEVSDDPTTFAAVDDLFNDLLDPGIADWFDAATSMPWWGERRCIDGDAESAIDRIVQEPPRAGETTYAPLRSLDLSAIRGLTWASATSDTSPTACRRGYYAGGDGPAVLLLSPFSIEPGYFAGIARELLRDHRVLIWQPLEHESHRAWYGDRLDEFTDGLHEMLAAEAPDGVHLVAWCAGVRVAASVIAESASRIRSLTLLAPDFGDPDESDAHKAVMRFCHELVARPDAASELVEQARRAFRGAAANLDQYQPRDARKRSPLRFHPVGFWSTVPDDAFHDPELALAWARRTVDNVRELDAAGRRLAASRIPTLAVLGTHDAMILAEVAQRRLHDVPCCDTLALLGANHYFLLEHAPLVGELLRRFVRDRRVDRRWAVGMRVRALPPATVTAQPAYDTHAVVLRAQAGA